MSTSKIPSHTKPPEDKTENRRSETDRVSSTGTPAEDDRRTLIAERAYFHAQRRGFQDDRQIDDWLRAEREIDQESRSSGVKEEASLKSDPVSDIAITRLSSLSGAHEGENIEPDHVQDWAQRLGVQPSRLREAIQRVGSRVPDVRRFLEASPQQHEEPRLEDESVAAKKPRATRKGKSSMDGVNREG